MPFTGIAIDASCNKNNPFDLSKIKTKTTFKHGKKDGLCEYFNGDGQLLYRENFKNNKKDGPWEWFYFNNGQLGIRIKYKNGKQHVFWELFDSMVNLKKKLNNNPLYDTL